MTQSFFPFVDVVLHTSIQHADVDVVDVLPRLHKDVRGVQGFARRSRRL